MKTGQLLNIVDNQILHDADVEQLKEVANIANRCLKVKGEERPTMKEVAVELEGLQIVGKHGWESVSSSSEETENFINSAPSVLCLESGINFAFDCLSQISTSFGSGK